MEVCGVGRDNKGIIVVYCSGRNVMICRDQVCMRNKEKIVACIESSCGSSTVRTGKNANQNKSSRTEHLQEEALTVPTAAECKLFAEFCAAAFNSKF